MAEKTNVPEIRFAGFTDPWEQRKLGEIFEEYSEKNRADLPPLTIIQGGGTVYRDESNRNLQFDKNSLSNYKAVNPDDFIVHLRSFEGGLEKATCCGLISPAYHTFHGDGIDSDFYYLYFRSKRFIDTDLKPHVYGIRDGRSIDIDGMKTIPIPWTTVNEQRAIGGFYNSFDSFITLHQRKYDKLAQLKKSMLDKMFPKPGERFPEIRFAGFTDPWEQRKLGEVATRHDNLRIPITAKDRIPGDTPYYGANGIQDYVEGYTHEGEFVLVAEDGATDLDNYPVQLISGLSWVNNHAHVIKAIPGVAQNRFIMHLIKSMDIASYLVGGTRSKLNAEVLMGIELKLPSNSEQIYIGALLSTLDSLITLHQRMGPIFCFCAHGSRTNFASTLQG